MRTELYAVVCIFVVGTYGRYNGSLWTGLDISLARCLNVMQNYVANLNEVQICYKSSLYRCTQHYNLLAEGHVEFQPLCGVLNSGTKVPPTTWTISVYTNFAIFIRFLHFNLPCTIKCQKASLKLGPQLNLTYCGRMMPWNISFQLHTVLLEYKSEYVYPGFHFAMVYEAIDITSPLLGTHVNCIITQKWNEKIYKHWEKPRIAKHSISTFGNIYSKLTPNTRDFYLKVDELYRVCIEVTQRNSFEIHDGPGILSEIVKVKNDFICLSGYYAFVREKLTVFNETLGTKVDNLLQRDESFTWRRELVDKPSIYCMRNATMNRFHMWIRTQSYKVLHCVWTFRLKDDNLYDYDEIHINRLNFRGHNFLSYDISEDICHLGGLIVKTRSLVKTRSRSKITSHLSYRTMFSLCENTYDTPLMIPRKMTDRLDQSVDRDNIVTALSIVFSSYYPYSKGFIDISFEVPSCRGFGYEIYTCLDCGLPLAVKLNKARNGKWWIASGNGASATLGFVPKHSHRPIEFPKCAKVWLLHNFNYLNRIYNANNTACQSSDWQYTFQHAEDTKLGDTANTFKVQQNKFDILNGNHRISVRHRVLPILSMPYSGHTVVSHDHYSLHIELTSIKDFPDDFTYMHQNLSVTNGDNVDIPLSHVISVTFRGNSSPHNMQATVTKVNFIHNTICAELNSTPFQIDNSVVFLHLDGLFEQRRFQLPEGDCSIFKANIPCNISKPDNLLIDFLPVKPLDNVGVELGITLRGESCVRNCRFNVSIRTNMENKLLSLKAAYLTSAKWTFRAMTASFRVQTNMSCYTQCAGYCNISITFKTKTTT